IDEATKVVTLADRKKPNVGRFDDRWISAVSGDVSYELDRQNGNLSYASLTDAFRQMGVYTGRILKGVKPADLPVIQSTKFELVINAEDALMLNLDGLSTNPLTTIDP